MNHLLESADANANANAYSQTMNAPKYSEAAMALAVTIDGISKQVSSIVLSGASVPSASVRETTESTSDETRKCKEHFPSAAATTTPPSNIQSERSFLSSELKQESLKFPLLEETSVTNSRLIRKWKLKPHCSFKKNMGAPTAVPYRVNSSTTEAPRVPSVSSAKTDPPKTPKTCLLTSPPPMALRRKNAEIHLPPNLRDRASTSIRRRSHSSVETPPNCVVFVSS
ncbi:hypothetical protein HJC23_005258 [Cyclotella cryptica]|uniref:Uncharacterized protein n=1 Tax=Cyclotella cryptica TaxID=29204 RepID=A0ABD3PLS3_9STRA